MTLANPAAALIGPAIQSYVGGIAAEFQRRRGVSNQWRSGDQRRKMIAARNQKRVLLQHLGREATARHESGHAAAIRYYGWAQHGIWLHERGDRIGGEVAFDTYRDSHHGQRHELTVTALAGDIAECKYLGCEWSWGLLGNYSDEGYIMTLYQTNTYPDCFSFHHAREEAELIINRFWGGIERLAERLIRDGEVSGSEVGKFFNN